MNEENTLIGTWILLLIILIVVVCIIGMLLNMANQSWKSDGGNFYQGRSKRIHEDISD